MRYKRLETNTLVYAYKLHATGAKGPEIIEKAGVSNPYTIIKTFERILAGTLQNIPNLTDRYFEAVDILRNEGYIKETSTIVPDPVPVSDDPYGRLNKGFKNFMDSIDQFITYQVDRKVAEIKKENEVLKAELDQYKKEYQTVTESAKNSNFVNNLKNKWG